MVPPAGAAGALWCEGDGTTDNNNNRLSSAATVANKEPDWGSSALTRGNRAANLSGSQTHREATLAHPSSSTVKHRTNTAMSVLDRAQPQLTFNRLIGNLRFSLRNEIYICWYFSHQILYRTGSETIYLLVTPSGATDLFVTAKTTCRIKMWGSVARGENRK